MRCCLLFVFPFLANALTHYEIEGTYAKIKSESVKHTLNNRAGFLQQENEIKLRLLSLHEEFAKELLIDFFEVHGEDHSPTAVFHGYLTTELTRNEIESKLGETDDIHIYVLAKRDSLPDPSIFVSQLAAMSSCSNGGVLLPNATCACKPFYSGDACEMVQCFHEGIQIGARCSCSPGVSTINCEPRKCQPAVAGDFTRTKASFILVINQNFNVGQTLTALVKTLENMQFISNYNTYIVVNFLNSTRGFYMQKKQFVYFNEMLTYVEALTLADGNLLQPTNLAILTAQSFGASMAAFSEVIVITQSADSQDLGPSFVVSSTVVEDRLVLKSLAWRNRISYFIPSSARFGDPTHMQLDSYHRVAQATFGDVFYVNDSDVAYLTSPTIFDTVLPALPYSEVVALELNGTAATSTIDITGTQYGNVTLLVSVKPGNPFPDVQSASGVKTPSDIKTYVKMYTLTADETITISNGVSWTAKVLAQTTTTVILGYSDNADIDVGNAYLLSGINQTVSGQTVSFASTAALNLQILNGDTKLTSSARDGDCSFAIYFGSIQLPILGKFITKVTFTDDKGINNTRLIPGFAGQLDFVNPMTFTCLNGGTIIEGRICKCPNNFNGSDCSVPICGSNPINQFPGNGQGLCSCPQGLTGDFCDQAVCYPYNLNYLSTTNRCLSVVIQASWSQAQYNNAIVAGIRQMLNSSGVVYNLYQLITFNTIQAGGSSISKKPSYSYYYTTEAFLDDLQNINYTATLADKLDSLTALDLAIQQQFYDKSPVILFVDSLPSNTKDENLVLAHALARQSQINVFVTDPFGQQSFAPMDYYRKFTLGTAGLYQDARIQSTNAESDIIFNTLANYAKYYYGTETVSEAIPKSCKDSLSLTVTLKPTTTNYFVINSDVSSNFTVSINGANAPSVFDIGNWAIYQIPSDLFANSNNSITISGGSNSNGVCSGKVIVKSTEVSYAAFMPLGLGMTNSTVTLSEGQTYLPTVYSTSQINNLGTKNVQITITNTNGTTIYSNKASVPDKCSQQAPFTVPFGCDGTNDQYIITSTTILADYTLQRSQRALCFLPYQGCLNGGSWNSMQCSCPNDYGGNSCEIKKCKNGVFKTDNAANICVCPAGYSGDLCQNRVCDSMNFMELADVRENDFEQIVFAVNTNVDMLLVNIYLQGLVQNFTGDNQVVSNPRQYTLITFDDTNVNVISSTFDSDKFNSDFKTALGNFSRNRLVPTRSLDAIHQSLRSVVQPSATVFLITGTNSTDPFFTSPILPRQRLGSQINVIYAPQSAIVPPQPSDTRLVTAARLSGGRILPVTQNSLNILNQIVSSSLTENALLLDDGKEDCTGGASFTFSVENSASQLIFDISGDGVLNNLTISNSTRKVPYINQFQDTATAILQINISGSQGGQWTLLMTSRTGSCFLQVRAVTPLRVIPGFVSNDNDDFPRSEPYSENGNNQTTTVFRISGDPRANLATLNIKAQSNLYEPWTSITSTNASISTRDGETCSFQFISDKYSLTKGTFVKLLVIGSDSTSMQFQRTFYYQIPPIDSSCNVPNGQMDTISGNCVCSKDYYGDDCSELRCRNGGTSSFGICACPTGFYGQFCDAYASSNGTTLMPTSTTLFSTVSSTSTILPSTSTLFPSTPVSSPSTFGPISSSAPTSIGTKVNSRSTITSTQSSATSSNINPSSTATTINSATESTTTLPQTVTLTSGLAQTTSVAASTSQRISTIDSTTTIPSTTPSTTTGTTTMGPCAPADTTYYFTFLIDTTGPLFDPPVFYTGQNNIVDGVATNVSLGSGLSGTRCSLSGVASDFIPYGEVKNTADIDNVFNAQTIVGNLPDRVLDLTSAINMFLTNTTYSTIKTEEKPGFAILFAQSQPSGTKENFVAAVQQLKDANYNVLGIISSLFSDPTDYFTSALGSQNVFVFTTQVDEAVTFINKRACQLKPI